MNDTTRERILAAADKLIDATAKAVLTDLRERVKELDRWEAIENPDGRPVRNDEYGEFIRTHEVLGLIEQMLSE